MLKMRLATYSLIAANSIHCAAWAQTENPARSDSANVSAPDGKVIDRLPEHLLYIYAQPTAQAGLVNGERQLSASKRRWEQGRTLRVCLFGGNPVVARLIREVAGEWNNYSGVKFDFGTPNAWYNCLNPSSGYFQIRIGFSEKGYWSTVGNDSEVRLQPLQPSMNFEDFNMIYSDLRQPADAPIANPRPYDLAVIRHEFGHALGLLHEHQNPTLHCMDQIKWKGPGNVYEYLSQPPNNWNPSEVDRNLGYIGATDPDYVAGQPDAHSIMMYSLPPQVFIEGNKSKCYVQVNYNISPKDKEIISQIYPLAAAGQPNTPGDLDIKTANLNQLPKFVDAPNREDFLSRSLVDLQSQDKYIRRDARARLAEILRQDPSPEEVKGLVSQMKQATYRFQLGVAVALANARDAIQVDPATKKALLQLSQATSDVTLKRALQAAGK